MSRQPFSTRHDVTLDKATSDLVANYAATITHKPITKTISIILRKFFEEGESAEVGNVAGAIESMEERIVATLSTQSGDLYEQQKMLIRLMVVTEKLAAAVLLHAPKPTEDPNLVTKRGEKRMEEFMKLVEAAVEKIMGER